MVLEMEILRGRLESTATFSTAFIILYKHILHLSYISLLGKIPSFPCSLGENVLIFKSFWFLSLILHYFFSYIIFPIIFFFPAKLKFADNKKGFLAPEFPNTINHKTIIRLTCNYIILS